MSRSDDLSLAVGFNPRTIKTKCMSRQRQLKRRDWSVVANATEAIFQKLRVLKHTAKFIMSLRDFMNNYFR